ncbi:Alpha/Beta hydrolase protein [Stachybotrys elegans]|uniref:Alpha/Beta hydrolase protein n=1 Tax=Stachybotrys elegans TaxID=80388 RepID=A0A8K0WVM3_9HYPO|nr:Alpha/Beta hydrolase protein [Stachybotrys elegans]
MSRWLVGSATPALRAAASARQQPPLTHPPLRLRAFTTGLARRSEAVDPRLRGLGREISDDYAKIRDYYGKFCLTRHPIVLAHGLLGFAELKVLDLLPPVQYWYGIADALTAQGATVITATVPPSGSIEERAAKLGADIAAKAPPDVPVSIIAHSMGGLDARYMISNLRPAGVKVASLVTVATPHYGSPFADFLLDEQLSPIYLPKLYKVIERAGFGTKAFAQLTTQHMKEQFNPATPDDPNVQYFSYGATLLRPPPPLSPFRQPHRIISEAEGPNDGLVSVDSSRWGTYKGTLLGVGHLDLINWSNRIRWTVREMLGQKRTFNAVAFYLGIADMLAKEGL